MRESQGNIRASLLDRLIDQEPALSYEPVQYRLLDMREMRVNVVRDLEHLLNTRRIIDPPPPAFTQANRSVLTFGLQDFTSHNPKSAAVRKLLRQDIEQAIALFEPRLRNVKVQLEPDQKGHSLRFRINAMLVIEPEREPVQFDTYFDLNRAEFVVER
ncbi:MAG: type VI secretion system baseplate subunit TssE [Syntrophaceae bacterium]